MAVSGLGILTAAGTYYVSASGSDSNNGLTTSTPWLTIAKVNATTFSPGDRIKFRGGDTFSGSISINDSGTASERIVISSYGTGQAKISCGDNIGIELLNCEYVSVNNMEVEGSGVDTAGSTSSIHPGISVLSTQTTGLRFRDVRITNNKVHGCRLGIIVDATNSYTAIQSTYRGYTGVLIEDNEVYECGHTGILIVAQKNWGSAPDGLGYGFSTVLDVHTSFMIRFNNVYDMYGRTENLQNGGRANFGTGIRTMSLSNSTVEYNRVYNVGHCGNNAIGTCAAFESEVSNGIIWQFNEAAYCIINDGANDGAGFDVFDGGSENMTVRYNYAHDNDGYGLGGGATGSPTAAVLDNNVAYFNIFVNNGRNNSTGGATDGDICLWGPFSNFKFFNNLVYSDINGMALFHIPSTATGYVANNIFISLGTRDILYAVNATTPLLLNNLYWRGSAGGLEIYINGTTYNTLATLRAAGQETLSGTDYGFNAAPLLVNAGANPDKLMAALVETLTDYDLDTGSPALDTAVNFAAQLGSYPLVDFHVNTFSLTQFNIGPDQ